MAETNEVQALEKVSAEVDKSQIKIILSSQCIKAQAFLYDKLRKQSERQKDICKFISSGNSKLETEIQCAEQEIKSLHLAIETIKFGNVELKKNYLLSKERKAEILERTKIGKKKYESVWLKAKTRYESIPCVKKLIEANTKSQGIRASIDSLLNDSKQLIKNIAKKEIELTDLDKKCVIALANFFVNERPKILETIRAKSNEIKDLSREVNVIFNEQKKITTKLINEQSGSKQSAKQIDEAAKYASLEESWSKLNKNINKETLLLPRLHLQNNDLDMLSVKLDQIKKVDLQNTTPIKRAGSYTSIDYEKSSCKKTKTEDNKKSYITPLTNITIDTNSNNTNEIVEFKKYSEKKLIHILEDIKLDKNDTYSIIHKLEPNQFQETKYVKSNNVGQKHVESPEKINVFMEIEEINSSLQHDENVVAPPSQYVDITQCTQEKKVGTFNFQTDEKIKTLSGDALEKLEDDNIKSQSQDKILDTSTTSEECYTTIKEMILKKHNLNLSPQFVYAKNNLKQMQHKDELVTSKFFENKNEFEISNNFNKNCNENIRECEDNELDQTKDENAMTVATREAVTSPKVQQDIHHAGEKITGFLFNHGPEGIPESLNVSISTTGFDDSEDFPQCIDSSLLLSPKADLTAGAANSGNNEVLSQEVPNFLAGFRKKGLSFFGCGPASEGKPDSSAQNQNSGFNFTFGNDEKKGRGGLFSMFR